MENKAIAGIIIGLVIVVVLSIIIFPSLFSGKNSLDTDITGKNSCLKWVSVNFIKPDADGNIISKSGDSVDMFSACQKLTGLYDRYPSNHPELADDEFWSKCEAACRGISS
ncbi:MAG: hypothetical protein PHU12_02935 [Candidatus Aenigmarchaeota archaeon]|nr:hypothetical protein [Candidatus Aenigmarchaeota archaeon]